jgi:hypothetical protein
VATDFPTFEDVPPNETPDPEVPDVDAAFLNLLTTAVNVVENQLPAKANSDDLATVATTGAYTDLIGVPFIPTEPGDIDAQPAGDYATNTAVAGKAPLVHTHNISAITATGTPSASNFLRGDGTWSPPPPDISGGINGAVGDGVVDDTAAINSALLGARTGGGGLVKGAPGSTYLISAPLVIGSNTVLDMTGCHVVLDPAVSQSNMLANYAVGTVNRTVADGAISSGTDILVSTAAAWTSADIGRTVVVPGAGVAASGLATTPLVARITAVAGTDASLDTEAATTVATASVSIYERDENILVIGGTWDAGANAGGVDNPGRHILRFRRVDDLTVRDVRVTCTDGKYAINPADVSRVKITDVWFDTSSDGIHVQGPAAGVTIRGVAGTTGDDAVALGCDDLDQYTDVAGEIRDVVVEDVDVTSEINIVKFFTRTGLDINNVTIRNVRGTSLGEFTGISLTDGNINNVLIDGLNVRGTGDFFISAQIACSSSKVSIRNVVSTTGFLCQVVTGVTVGSLLVQGVTHASQLSGEHMVVVLGTVTNLSVSDFTATLPTNASLIRLGTGATLTAAYISDGVCTGVGDGALFDAQVASGTLNRVVLRGIRASDLAWGYATQLSGEVNLSDIDFSAANGIVYVAGGNAVIRNGQGITGTALGTFRDAGTLAVRAPDFPIDLDLVNSRTTGDRAYNTDGGLGCGVGPVAWTGSTWQNLATGATFTPA